MATPIPAPPEHHQASFTHFPPHSPSEHSPLGDQHPQDASRADGQDFEAGFQIPPDFHISARGMTTNGHEPVQMPRGPTSNLPPRRQSHRSTMSMSAFDISRSPPNPKSTSHVPCKFFRTGQCQAGPACPFSHDFASTGDEICRYFQKVILLSGSARTVYADAPRAIVNSVKNARWRTCFQMEDG